MTMQDALKKVLCREDAFSQGIFDLVIEEEVFVSGLRSKVGFTLLEASVCRFHSK